MPRRKSTRIFAGNSPEATGKYRTRRLVTGMRPETGDPEKDGELWATRISHTKQWRAQRKNGEKDWRRYYEWYRGEQWNDRGTEAGTPNSDNARDTATINKTGSIINSIVPFLVNGEIRFRIKPRKPPVDDQDQSAQIQQSLLNYEWRERKMTKQIKMCARDFVIIGHCISKTGYTVEVDESRRKDEVINYSEYVKQDAPYIERVNPLDFLFDPGARDHSLRTARWCAEIFHVPLADVLANKSYDKKVLDMLWTGSPSPTMTTAFWTMTPKGSPWTPGNAVALPEEQIVPLVEIFDKRFRQRIIYADGIPQPLLHEPWPYDYLDGFPYCMATYIDDPNSPYGIGLPRWIEDQQIQLNRMATLEQDVARKSRPRYAASDGTNPEEVKKFTEGDELIVGDIKPIQPSDLSQGFQLIEQNIQRAIEEMTGADALLQGQQLPSRTTASEIGARTKLTSLKLDQHVADFEEFVEENAVQVLQHLKKHRTVPDVIEIVGPQSGPYWTEYSSEDIQAETDVEVNYFAAPKHDPQVERQQRKEIFELAITAMPVMAEQGQMVFDIPQLFAWTLEPYEEPDVNRFFKPPPPRPPLPEGESEGAGAGLPPALAGTLAPGQIPQQPTIPAPQEGLSPQDLAMSVLG